MKNQKKIGAENNDNFQKISIAMSNNNNKVSEDIFAINLFLVFLQGKYRF